MIEREFFSTVAAVARSEEFEMLCQYRHHLHSTVYGHSLRVAYLCYRHAKKFGLKIDTGCLVRGAMLHDYYLYDRTDKLTSPRLHWLRHPRYALKNALTKYPDLSAQERDMILRHMFPLTFIPPRTKAGWLICFYDKVAAVGDLFGKPHRTSLAASRPQNSMTDTR